MGYALNRDDDPIEAARETDDCAHDHDGGAETAGSRAERAAKAPGHKAERVRRAAGKPNAPVRHGAAGALGAHNGEAAADSRTSR